MYKNLFLYIYTHTFYFIQYIHPGELASTVLWRAMTPLAVSAAGKQRALKAAAFRVSTKLCVWY